jgi:hypothetical protein
VYSTCINLKENKKMTRYIYSVEAAKIIRKQLKEKFPKTKFSVKSDNKNDSVKIFWEDEDSYESVTNFLKQFKGKISDTDDSTKVISTVWQNENVAFDTFIFSYRTISDHLKEDIEYAFDRFVADLFVEEVSDYREAYLNYKNLKTDISNQTYLDIRNKYLKKLHNKVKSLRGRWNTKFTKAVNVIKITSIRFKLTGNKYPQNVFTEYLYQGDLYSETAFIKCNDLPPSDLLTIEGIEVSGKIAEFINSKNLVNHSLQDILILFYQNS